MNLAEALVERYSKTGMQQIAAFIGDDKKKFGELMKLALGKNETLAAKASWAAIHTADKKQKLIDPWIGKMIQHLETCTHHSIKRNFLRLFENITIPEKYRSPFLDIAYQFLLSTKEAIAVRVFSMTVVFNITKLHPELKNELKLVVEDLLIHETAPAIQARGKRTLKLLAKI